MDFEDVLDFTNYRKHPTDRRYLVYHYTKKAQADYFEHLLVESKLFFERHEENREGKGVTYYFAIKRVDEKNVAHFNNLAIGRYRNRFIPDNTLRYFVIAISIIAISLAVIGFILKESNVS